MTSHSSPSTPKSKLVMATAPGELVYGTESNFSLFGPEPNSKPWFQIFKKVFFGCVLLFITIEVIGTLENSSKNANDKINNPRIEDIYGDHFQLVSPYFPENLLRKTSSHSVRSQLRATVQKYKETDCMEAWPNVVNCSVWIDDPDYGFRYLLTNSIPPFETKPYCPFGVGLGYCFPSGSTDCPQFSDMVCPSQAGRNGTDGDVIVPMIYMYRFEINPDPTSPIKPLNLYQNNSAIWLYEHSTSDLQFHVKNPPPMNYQVTGAHISGQQLKGPAEAEGYNVDMVGIPFNCGGHITPPIGLGPLWHFHKASLCLDESVSNSLNIHSELQGYANDGFPIYGISDENGAEPMTDECNGHFGVIPGAIGSDGKAKVMYHYHMRNTTFTGDSHFEPYWIGCLGPSKGQCNDTVAQQFDVGANWCGVGCGYDICVQPGTPTDSLNSYLNEFDSSGIWMDQFTVNPY